MQGRLPQMVRAGYIAASEMSTDYPATYGCAPSRYAMTELDPSLSRADTVCRGYRHLPGNTAAAFQHLGVYRRRSDNRHDARAPGYGQVDRGRARSGYHLK